MALSSVLVVAMSWIVAGQGVQECAHGRIVPAAGQHAFRKLGHRCEGYFKQPVGADVRLISLSDGKMAPPTADQTSVFLTWSDFGNGVIEISGLLRETGTYWAMWQAGTLEGRIAEWPLDELRAANFATPRLAVLASTKPKTGPDVFVPVQVTMTSSAEYRADRYYLLFTSATPLIKFYWKVTDLIGDAEFPFLPKTQKLKHKHEANNPIQVDIPRSTRGKGRFLVEVTVEGTTGGAASRSYAFLHD